jgi:myo-inositol catabolism protein IolH
MKFDGIMTVCVFAWEERAHESSRNMRETIEKRVQSWS